MMMDDKEWAILDKDDLELRYALCTMPWQPAPINFTSNLPITSIIVQPSDTSVSSFLKYVSFTLNDNPIVLKLTIICVYRLSGLTSFFVQATAS